MINKTVKVGGVTVPANLTKEELLKFLVENKAMLIAEKKSAIKEADPITVGFNLSETYTVDKDGKLCKSASISKEALLAGGPETVLCVINTTNWMDSHSDVHIPGLWKKTLKDNKQFIHLQEHEMAFDHVISDEAKGYTENLAWKELGLEKTGTTEALIFATPLTGRNPYMEDQYRKGFVKNHSVGMRYVVIKLCVNEAESEYYKEEYANWVQYAPMIANIEDAESQGYFWAVLEAKIVEGSAVVKGSNIITPTMGFKSAQPVTATEKNEPELSTQEKDEKPDQLKWDKMAERIGQFI